MKKILLMLMFISLSATVAFSGGQNETSQIDEPITLTYFARLNQDAAQVMKDYSGSYPFQVKEEMTGIRIKWIHAPVGIEQELAQYNLMIASGDLPDIMEMGAYYKGGPDKGIADGVFLRLNELIDEHAPNYKAILDSDPEIARLAKTDEGNIFAFQQIQPVDEPPWLGLYIREDLLDQAGLSMPTTIDEWDTVLRAFKQMGVDVPLLYQFDWMSDWAGCFSGAFNSHTTWMREGNEVVYGPLQPGFKEFLATMNTWYKDGLIDSEMATRDGNGQNALITRGEMGAFTAGYGWVGTYEPALHANGFTDAKISPAPYPGAHGKASTIKQTNFRTGGDGGIYATITTACENPEAAVQWFDFGYDEFGYLLHNYGGIEGETYIITPGEHEVVASGIPQMTDLLLNNPETPYQFAKWTYKTHVGPFLRDFRAFPQDEMVLKSMDVWDSSSAGEGFMPPIMQTDEESRKISAIMGDIETYVAEMRLKFVLGIEPIESFDEFVKQVESMGIDEAIAAKQAALDRYNNR